MCCQWGQVIVSYDMYTVIVIVVVVVIIIIIIIIIITIYLFISLYLQSLQYYRFYWH